MFEIQYHFVNQNLDVDRNLDEENLRYQQFLGSFNLVNDDKVLTFDWDWIPLLDFAISLLIICRDLTENKISEKEFEFTESDSEIIFKRSLEELTIYDGFSNDELSLSFENFRLGVSEFCKKLLSDILRVNSNLKENKLTQEYINELAMI